MMDWTDEARMLLRTVAYQGEDLAVAFCSSGRCASGGTIQVIVVALIANNSFIAYDADGGVTHEHHGKPR